MRDHISALRSVIRTEFSGEWGADGPTADSAECFVIRATNLVGAEIDYGGAARRHVRHSAVQAKRLIPGDIVLEASGGGPGVPVGRVAPFDPLDDRVYLVSNFFRTLRPTSQINPRYLAHALDALYRSPSIWRSQQQTTGIVNLKLRDYLDSTLFTPPLEEQRQIAEVLDTIDDAIRSTERLVAKLAATYRALLRSLLRGGGPMSGEIRRPTADWTIGRLDGLDDAPESWRLVRLADVCGLESGHTPARTNPAYWGGDVQWVSLHDTARLQFRKVISTTLTITEAGIANSSARVLPAGTVALSRTATIGKAVELGAPMATSQDFACFPPAVESLAEGYLLHLFREMEPVWRTLAAGSTHQTIYMPIFKRLQVLLPPVDQQRSITRTLDAARETRDNRERELAKLRMTRTGLANDLLSGRVRTVAS